MKYAIPMGIFVALVIVLAVGLTLDPRYVPSPLIGKPLPNFALPDLANPEQPTIGLIDSLRIRGGASPQLAMRGVQAPPWTVATHLGQLFKIKEIKDGDAVIPDEVAALMITHPKSLGDKTLYAIDQEKETVELEDQLATQQEQIDALQAQNEELKAMLLELLEKE